MPRACPVDLYVADGAKSVKLHGTSPWHLGFCISRWLAANVSLHGTSPWHHAAVPFGLPAWLLLYWIVTPTFAASPESKAVEFLSREVPAWSTKNGCYSCHNNGDGAKALYVARGKGYAVPESALADSTTWLLAPAKWEQDLGTAEFKDGRLARIQFAAALAETVADNNKAALRRAAELLAKDQAEEGSWPLVTGGNVASPVTYGPILATHFARRTLGAADAKAYRDALLRSQRWLEQVRPESVLDASAILWSLADVDTRAAARQRTKALDMLRQAEAKDGGWGPFATSPSEVFDTAVAVLALAEISNLKAKISNPLVSDPKPMLVRGRQYLLKRQQEDGSWPATTRPAGVDSYAQYISTTAWALQALLATRVE